MSDSVHANVRYLLDLDDLVRRIKADLKAELLSELRAELGIGSGREWLSFPDAVAHLGVTPGRLRKLVATRAIPYSQEAPGCRIAFSRCQLDRHMAGLSTQPNDERTT